MKWKHIKNIDSEARVGEMFLYDELSDEKINGADFALEMRWLRNYQDVSTIIIKINSVGGGVMHAKSIISEMLDSEECGVCVKTKLNGLGASSAAVIWAAAKPENRFAKDYARAMFHGVHVAPDEEGNPHNLTEDDIAALQNFQDSLITILANRTGKKEKYFKDLFTNGKDNWFDVPALIKAGLLIPENVENTDINVDIDPKEKTAGVVAVYNKLNTTIENNSIIKNETKMKKVIALLKLQDGVSEEVVADAVSNVQNSLTAATTKLATANSRIEELENKLKDQKTALDAAQEQTAIALVKNAVQNGQIDPSKEAEALVQAKANPEGFKNTLSLLPVKAANIINQLNGEQPTAVNDENPLGDDKRTFRQLEKEAPEVLNSLKKSNLKGYVNLYNREYKTNKTEADFK